MTAPQENSKIFSPLYKPPYKLSPHSVSLYCLCITGSNYFPAWPPILQYLAHLTPSGCSSAHFHCTHHICKRPVPLLLFLNSLVLPSWSECLPPAPVCQSANSFSQRFSLRASAIKVCLCSARGHLSCVCVFPQHPVLSSGNLYSICHSC